MYVYMCIHSIYMYSQHYKSTILQFFKKSILCCITFVDFRMLSRSGFGLIHIEFLLLCAEMRWACAILFLSCPYVVLAPKLYWICRGGWEGRISSFFYS